MNKKTYFNIVRGFAIYDIIALAPFALPWLAAMQIDLFEQIHDGLGLSGARITAVSPNEMVFFNMLGIAGTAWAIWRLRNTSIRLGIFEGWVRAAFAVVLLYASLFNGASMILVIFGLVDVVAAPLHWLGYRLTDA